MVSLERANQNQPGPKGPERLIMAKKQEETRGRGRPSNFPGVKTIARLYKLPTETVQMVETLAEERDENLAVTLDAMIRRAFNATRPRTSKRTKAEAAPVAEAAPEEPQALAS